MIDKFILNGIKDIAPTELQSMLVQSIYYDIAPTELNKLCKEKFYYDVAPKQLF